MHLSDSVFLAKLDEWKDAEITAVQQACFLMLTVSAYKDSMNFSEKFTGLYSL